MEKNDFPYRGWLHKLAPDGTEEWVKTEQDLIIMIDMDTTLGEDWHRGLRSADGNLGIGGSFPTRSRAGAPG
jgi:hypothetical protein